MKKYLKVLLILFSCVFFGACQTAPKSTAIYPDQNNTLANQETKSTDSSLWILIAQIFGATGDPQKFNDGSHL